jgi:GT2 family glycosyltransferase
MADLTVSIIIITYNRPFLLQHAIKRVLAQPYPHKELIVVDSSSNNESERVIAEYPEALYVRLHRQRNNMPRARNEGIAVSSGDIIAFIDDDTMVQVGWLESLIDVYRDETIGAAGGRVIGMPEPYCDQVKGPPRLYVGDSSRVIAKDVGLVSASQVKVDHLIGCNMSFRRKALEQVGGFDPNYTLTNLREETDLCVRVKKAGWRIVFKPSIEVVHFSARSLQPYFLEQPGVQFSNARNCTYFAIKHFGLKPRTFAGQMIDMGRSCGRVVYFTLLFSVGMVAHMAGRIVGLGVGIAWHMNSQLRAMSAPRIGRGEQVGTEQVSLPVASQSESLTCTNNGLVDRSITR